MNPYIAFPAPKPELKIRRDAAGAEARGAASEQLDAEIESLRERETNLRMYEARLRAWQEKIDQGLPTGLPQPRSSGADAAPVAVEYDSALQEGWEKLARARAMIEAEQAHLKDDRLNLKASATELKRREDVLLAREARLVQREEELDATIDARIAEQTRSATSTLARLTQAPFAMAKSVFSSKPKSEE